MTRCATLACLALIAGSLGCHPTFAPPVRAFQYGAPARLEKGRIEIGGSIGGSAVPEVGGPHIAVGIRDWVALELGANFYHRQWAMGFLGPRFSYSSDRRSPIRFIGDLELGIGAGVGGTLDCSDARTTRRDAACDGRDPFQRAAWGGYQGIGVGGRFHWFSLYVRARLEETGAVNVPTTFWPSFSLGLEAAAGRRAAFSFAGGYTGYYNSRDSVNGWFYQAGVAIFFDAFVDRPAPPVVEPTPPRPIVPPPPPPEETPPPPEETPPPPEEAPDEVEEQ